MIAYMINEVSSRVNSDDLELSMLSYWDERKIFKKSLENNKDKASFTFYDGPPYATGKPHYGHVLQSAIKDSVLRYKTMQGYYVPRRNGWDTHGLPIENIVEKELGITSKKQIEDDIEKFNEQCKTTMYRYVDEFRTVLQRMGRWADYGNEYSTMDRHYMESEWWVFQQLWKKELIYKAFRSTPYCIRCATPLSNFEVSDSYKDVKDMSVYVMLAPLRSSTELRGADQEARLLIWTTTPWTLPGNVAVAYNPEIAYVVAKKEDQEYILAKDRVKHILDDDAEIVREVTPEELSEYAYTPLYESSLNEQEKNNAFRLVPSNHVTAQDGTGLVHMAPAFGEDDYEVAKSTGLPVLRTVDTIGNFVAELPQWGGRNIFAAQKDIIKDLKTRGLLFKQELISHSYPFCWRCDTPLIYYALDTWFLKISALKERMLESNKQIHWVPEHVKEGRFSKGIEAAPDWAISRNRFWSVPMPIWECDACGDRVCIGSIAELQKKSGASDEQVQDIHRPYVDRISWGCGYCPTSPQGLRGAGTLHRVPEVLDVWFDSASMPYGQWHYPFENKANVEATYPADFIAESIEMTRQWFYVLHVLATALTQEDIGLGKNKPAFLNAIASGLIFAEDGNKLSKKLKNYPELDPVLTTYGADVLRFYLLSSSTLGEPYLFSEKGIRQVQRNVYLTLWNVYSMFTRYAKVHQFPPPAGGGVRGGGSNLLDRWITARTHKLTQEVTEQTDTYRIDAASRLFIEYIDDLSNWYVRRSRTRLQHPATPVERDEVFGTLYNVLVTVSKLLAPFMPFVSEEIYRNLTGEESVHLAAYPKPGVYDEKIISDIQKVRDAVSQGLALRAHAGIKVRQALAQLTILAGEYTPEDVLMIANEVNVKEVVLGDAFELDTNITEELKCEGIARDIIRFGQVLRKKAGYALDDRIIVALNTESAEIQKAIQAHAEMIATALQAELVGTIENSDASEEVKIDDQNVKISLKRS